MTNFETPLFRDLAKLYRPVLIIIIIFMASFLIITQVIPMIQSHYSFIENNNCVYFEEIGSICGQDAIDYMWENRK